MKTPAPALALALTAALLPVAHAERGDTSNLASHDRGTAPNPDLETRTFVDMVPDDWFPVTGDTVTEGFVDLYCVERNRLDDQGYRSSAIMTVAQYDDTWTTLGAWQSPAVCVQYQTGELICPVYLTPGLWVFSCAVNPVVGAIEIDTSNDEIFEYVWVEPAY